MIKSLNAKSLESPRVQRNELPNRIKKEVHHYEQNGKTYIQTIVENN